MSQSGGRASRIVNALFWLLALLGVFIAALGIALDFFPGTSPGFNLPQLLAIGGGLALALLAYGLRREDLRRRRWHAWRRNALGALLSIAVTLLVLELALTALNMSTYFPARIPEEYYSGKPWKICDEAGCHFDPDVLAAACDTGQAQGRYCALNAQGFHDWQVFAPSADLQDKYKIIALGDSFTFGMTADMGMSFIERIERDLPEAALWNLGIPGTGTQQALQSLSVYGPLMQPDVTLLAFYMNDFKDNLTPIPGQLVTAGTETEDEAMFRWVDRWGNVILLDLPSTWYYRDQRIDPPASELERLLGITRLGTLTLRLFDVIGDSADQSLRESRERQATRDYLTALRDTVTAQSSELLVLLVPHRNDLLSPGPRFPAAIELMSELGIPFIDPRAILVEAQHYTAKPDVHWNNAGHQKIGNLLSRCLRAFRLDGNWTNCENIVLP